MIFLLHAKLIQSRFHGIRHRKLNISWIIDVLGSGSPYFFILLDSITWIKSRKSGNILGKNGKKTEISETQEFRNFGNLMCPLFEFLKFRIPGFLLIRNDESWFLLIRNDEFMKIMKCPIFDFLKFWMPEFLIIRNDEFSKMMKSRRRGISWH